MGEEKDLQGYKCPNCGGPLIYKGDVQKMVCEYCDSTFEMSEFSEDTKHKDAPTDWSSVDNGTIDGDGMSEYICESCGAALITQETTGATECPYCGNPVVVSATFSGMNLPDAVLPFKVDKKSATDALKNFYKGKKLLPNGFVDTNHIDNISGMYVPFWLFDCNAKGSGFYNATIEKDKGDQKEIKEYKVMRSATMRFENVPADGAKGMKDEYMDSIEPFNFKELTDYNPAYLSGYVANKYDENQDEVKNRVDSRMRDTVRNELRSTVNGYTSVSEQSCNVDFDDATIRYCMLPVWMLSTRYKGEVYSFAMNGQTGKVTGDLPIDNGKKTGMFITTSLISFVVMAILFIIGIVLLEMEFSVITLIIALIIALIIGGCVTGAEVHKMTAHRGTSASAYLVKDSFKLIGKNDRHVRTRYEKKNTGSN